MALHHESRRARPKHPAVAATPRAELTLQATQPPYRQIIELAPAGVFVQCEGRFAYLNPKAMAMFGASLESDLLGRPVLDLLHPDDRDSVRVRIRRVSHERAIGPTLEARWQRLDGTTFHGESAAVPYVHQGQPGALVMLQDVTARKVAEEQRAAALEALRSRDDEIHAIVDNLAECVIAIDARGIVRSANPALARVLGFTAAEVIGRNVSMLMPEPGRGAHDGHIGRYLRTGEARVIGTSREVEGVHKDGSRVPLELTVTEYEVRGERAFIGLLRDIRERRRFIAELTEARAGAEQASLAKSAFLATMSHEIRTPMNGVIGMVEVLAHSGLTGQQAELVRTVRESATALLDIIDDILDFSKIEAGKLEIERAAVDVAGLVEGLCASMVPVAARGNVDLAVSVSPDIPPAVLSDALRLRQVLGNLVGNAIKFSGGRPGLRGRVSVRAEAAAATPARIVLTVADNGIGIAPEALDRLFAPFAQAEVSTTRRYGGTGLGLAICRRLVDLMQGDIAVLSEPGRGATFTVSLPVEVAQAAAIAVGRAPREAHDMGAVDGVDKAAVDVPSVVNARARGCLILVVEDDETNRKVIARQLELLGHAAQFAGNGEEGLRKWHDGGHALVLTDLHMPWMDGYSLVRAIRREEAGRSRVPVVALTANALRDEGGRALAAGMDECLAKPVQLRQLRAVLDRWLPAAGEADAARTAQPDGHRGPGAVPAVDGSVLEGAIGGEPAQARELLGAYLESARGLAQELRSSLAAGNPQAVAFLAHRLKSASRAVGAVALGDVCDLMECAGRSGDMAAVLRHLRGFETSLEAVEADIARTLARG